MGRCATGLKIRNVRFSDIDDETVRNKKRMMKISEDSRRIGGPAGMKSGGVKWHKRVMSPTSHNPPPAQTPLCDTKDRNFYPEGRTDWWFRVLWCVDRAETSHFPPPDSLCLKTYGSSTTFCHGLYHFGEGGNLPTSCHSKQWVISESESTFHH